MTFTLFIGIRAMAPKKLTFSCKEILFDMWIYVFCDDGWADLGSERRSRPFNGGFCWIWGKVSVFPAARWSGAPRFFFMAASFTAWIAPLISAPRPSAPSHTRRARPYSGRLGIAPPSLSSLQNDDSDIYSRPGPAVSAAAGGSVLRARGRSLPIACCFIKVMN